MNAAVTDAARLDRLTEKQKDVLRLAAQGYGAKEIATLLGGGELTESAVLGRIKAALKTLEMSDRFKAGRLLVAYEASSQKQASQSQDLAATAPAAPDREVSSTDAIDEHDSAGGGNEVREARTPYKAFDVIEPLLPSWPVPTKRRPRNDLTILQRAAWMLALTAFLLWGFAGLIGQMAVGTHVLRAIFGPRHPPSDQP